ncbi:MAG: hypothetical protein Kow0077_18580 [Anaerolineae bacterium]
MHRLNSRLIVFALVFSLVGPGTLPVLAQGSADFNTILRATVYISSVYDTAGGSVVSCIGSGTLITPDGLILTNAHNVIDGERCRVDDIAISLPVRLDEPPVLSYYADIVAYDLRLDLAVLRITRQIDGRRISEGTLRLPFVELGDSRQLRLDDTIAVFGYEGIGNDRVALSRGTIIGFIAEPRGEDRAWLKTSATILGPMAGGGAYDQNGRLIGIPTAAPPREREAVLDCRFIQDTNGDGITNNLDDCVPVGGFINALRPVHLARGLIRAAQLGIQDGGHVGSAQVSALLGIAADEPTFGPIRFAPSVNEAGQPTTFVTSMPTGTNSLYLVFEYRNMRPGIVYELRTTRNGDSVPVFSQSQALWPGGKDGLWYIGSSGQVWPNGVYEFTLLIEGRVVQTARITIGGAAQPTPTFSDIVFGLLDGNTVIGSGYVLGVANIISARFIFRDIPMGTPWSAVWYYEGVEIRRDSASWDIGPSGSQNVSITGDLLPGRYRLELYIEDRLSAMADLVLAGGQDGVFAQIFSNPRFASRVEGGSPAGIVAESFSAGISQLYAFVDWRMLGAGSPWTYRWLVDGDVFFEHTEPWVASESGSDFWFRLDSERALPDGTYTLEILIGGQLLVSRSARVGLGQLPVTSGDTATGVQVGGVVVDAETGEGIPGALFIVLEVQFSVEDFLWDEAQIFSMATTDNRGRFEIDRLLSYGELYSVIIVADGYFPVSADGIEFLPESEDVQGGQVAFRLEMNRDLIS